MTNNSGVDIDLIDVDSMKVVPFDPAGVVVKKVPVPVQKRNGGKNPFSDLADTLEIDGEAITFTVPQAQQQYVIHKVREAAPDRTIRQLNDGDELTLWATKRITRPRKRAGVTDDSVLHNLEGYAIVGDPDSSLDELLAQNPNIVSAESVASAKV